jgi:hypothetical protein
MAEIDQSTHVSWWKAFAHATAIAIAFFVPALLLAILGMVDGETAGEFSGGFVVPAFMLGLLWSYARQTARSIVRHVVLIILVAMSAYEVFVLVAAAVNRRSQTPTSALEVHSPLLVRNAAGSDLCQQDFGFGVHLGAVSLTAAPDIAKILKEKDVNDAVARWAYREGSGDIVVLMASKGFDSKDALQNFAKGAAGAAEGRMVKVVDHVDWESDHGSISLSFRQGRSRFDMHCVSAPNGDLGCIQTIGNGDDRLAQLRDSISVGSCD